MVDESILDHKLCGFLCAVLKVASPIRPSNLQQDLLFGSPCYHFNDGFGIGFKSESNIVLSVIDSSSNPELALNGIVSEQNKSCGTLEGEVDLMEDKLQEKRKSPETLEIRLQNSKKNRPGVKKTTRERKGMRSIGIGKGSISVVQQLRTLVSQKCLRMISRVVHVDIGRNQEARAVVLVDVYLPLSLFCGWQFPRSQATAAALFNHLSCDWELRSSILNGKKFLEENHGRIMSIWNLSDCHVLGCKLHQFGNGSPKRRTRKLFELHEIFKSLPSIGNKQILDSSRVTPAADFSKSGIWDLSDDILINILNALRSVDLVRVGSTCRHLRSLASLIMPCMKLKLFPHQQAAIEWMLHRERNAEVFPHPLYKTISTEDGFCFSLNTVSGDIVVGEPPTVKDFRGGMFCDEPGLGKTITALSLILKTQGTMADPPDAVQVINCIHKGNEKCAYYELICNTFTSTGTVLGKRSMSQSGRRNQFSVDDFVSLQESKCSSRKMARLQESSDSSFDRGTKTPSLDYSKQQLQCTRSLCSVKKNLLHAYDAVSEASEVGEETDTKTSERGRKLRSGNLSQISLESQDSIAYGRKRNDLIASDVLDETWVQCDSCCKWRRVLDTSVDNMTVWFCSMNTDAAHQSCKDPQEPYDSCQPIKYLQGFCTKGTSGGRDQNVSFFTSVLREYKPFMDSKLKKALTWLANLSHEELSAMEAAGIPNPLLGNYVDSDVHGFTKIFQAFGLTRRVVKGVIRWFYPKNLENLEFDLPALRIALCERLDKSRLYLSKATLIVVPANLVEHWRTQIERHVRPGQLRLLIWTDHKKPSAHSLAWDYDIVITTFSRLSAEWGPHKKSPLMQVHWLRIMLDEGHTLGSSLSMTNKLQMAISLTASNRWLLTGTPTPNTPNSQLSHLQPLLKFLHEEVYGENPKSWEHGILRPFEGEMEEGRLRLMQLLRRCMISARKKDLQTIPPCIKKTTYLSFTREHAGSYNELVETVRRNILMADWNDSSHVESLLNPKQWKFRSATIRNVRLSCCVAGHIKVTNAGQDIQETLDILVAEGLDPFSDAFSLVKDSLLCGGNCLRCKEWCRLPVVTPCRHLLCLDCVALDSQMCTSPGCGYLYEMQTPETLARPENPNPKWPVPKDLIELQPSYKQDDWNPDWQSTSSSKVCYLVERLKTLQAANGETFSLTNDNNANPEENLLSLSNSRNSSEFVHRFGVGSNKGLPVKVLVFSQFLEHIHVIEQQLTIAGIKFAGMYSPMHSALKMKSLNMFQQDLDCMALVMDGSAALGLDLSFVTHVFLMEPIWDRSMEEQVISRAHRMGATRPIHVETLAMCGTIEEQMLKFLQDADNETGFLKEEFGEPKREVRSHRTLHDLAESNYLARLGFVRTEAKA